MVMNYIRYCKCGLMPWLRVEDDTCCKQRKAGSVACGQCLRTSDLSVELTEFSNSYAVLDTIEKFDAEHVVWSEYVRDMPDFAVVLRTLWNRQFDESEPIPEPKQPRAQLPYEAAVAASRGKISKVQDRRHSRSRTPWKPVFRESSDSEKRMRSVLKHATVRQLLEEVECRMRR